MKRKGIFKKGGALFLILGFWVTGLWFFPLEARAQQDRAVIQKKLEERRKRLGKRPVRKKVEVKKPPLEERLEPYVSPYATTEEILLAREAAALRRAFVTTEPYFGPRVTEEQALFERLAREEEEEFYYAIRELEEKPWWRDLLESLSTVVRYEQGLYTNYFNSRARHDLWTEKPFFGGRFFRRGVLSADANYYVSLERVSFESGVSIDPHVQKTHGGQVRLLYRPTRRFHLYFSNEMRKTNKVTAPDERLGETSINSNVLTDTLTSQFRYFLTPRDVIDVSFTYDYSRAREASELRINRGYQPKISFIRAFGPRVILRGFWLWDYLMTTNQSLKRHSLRNEPGLGGTFVLGRRFSLDLDYARQFLKFRKPLERQRGHRVNLKLNHALTRRLTQSYILNYSKVEGKRSAISRIREATVTARELTGSFESLGAAAQFTYTLTPLTTLSVALDYTWTDSNLPDAETNNRKRITAELRRSFYGKKANLSFKYIFDRNDGEIPSTYLSHTFLLSLETSLGVGG